MIKKIFAITIACSLVLSGCQISHDSSEKNITTEFDNVSSKAETSTETETQNEKLESSTIINENDKIDNNIELYYGKDENEIINQISSLDDPKLLQYVEDKVYSGLVDGFKSEDYIIENVNAVYISKDYLEEVAYNSKANIWFGYTLEDLNEQFQGQSYVFTLGDDGTTVVEPFEDYDDTYDRIIKNVAIGTGVILVCVTVSVVSGGLGAAPISMVFAASAKTGTAMALSSGAFSGVVQGAITGIQTKDFDQAIKAAELAASESFKWGAITGAVVGGVSELSAIRKTNQALGEATECAKGSVEIPDDVPDWRKAELRALNENGGCEQLSFLDGKQVEFGTPGATRPDVVVNMVDHLEAVEVKYYNLESSGSLNTLYSELQREVAARVANMPAGTTQRIVLDVTGKGFSAETISNVVSTIGEKLSGIYPNIPVQVVGAL